MAITKAIAADDCYSSDGVHQAGDDVCPPPRAVNAAFGTGDHAAVDDGHQKLGNAAAEVTPTSGSGVGNADALAVEHAGHPELARDERGETETDAEATDQETSRVGDVGHAEAEGR